MRIIPWDHLMALYPPEYGFTNLPEDTVMVDDPEAPMRYAVWLDGDIIGANDQPLYAMIEAVNTVTGWGDA